MKLLDNIYLIKIDFVNVYMLATGEHIVLIDAGLPGRGRDILKQITETGYNPEKLEAIILTHHHFDHSGGLKEILEETRAKIYCHRDEKELVEKRTGVKIDHTLEDGDIVHGLRVIHTPGHTPGHICLFHEATGSLFVGDLLYEENGVLYEIPHKYSADPEENRASIAKLLRYGFKHVLPSHGYPVIGRGREALEDLVARLRV